MEERRSLVIRILGYGGLLTRHLDKHLNSLANREHSPLLNIVVISSRLSIAFDFGILHTSSHLSSTCAILEYFGNFCYILPGLTFPTSERFQNPTAPITLILHAKFMFIKYAVQNMAPYLTYSSEACKKRVFLVRRESICWHSLGPSLFSGSQNQLLRQRTLKVDQISQEICMHTAIWSRLCSACGGGLPSCAPNLGFVI